MRKLGARSIAVALVAVLISGCSSTGGNSFSWSRLNPATYFANSDSDSAVPKPSDQMAPTVTLGNASDVASASGSSGGMAPPSQYDATQAVAGLTQDANSLARADIAPQRGMYNPNGYGSDSLPLSPPASGFNQYATQPPAGAGYQLQQSGSGYNLDQPAQYGLGGGSYDIQQPTTAGGSMGLPAHANPTAPYANNAAPPVGANTSPYQVPPLPPQASGYDGGLAQDPYGSVTPPPYSSATPSSPPVPWGTGVNPENSFADSSASYPAESRDMGGVATLPQRPAQPGEYTNSQPAWEPGNTGFNPPNVPDYSVPSAGGDVQPATATGPTWAPGSVTRYPAVPPQSAPTAGAVSGGYGTAGSVY
jgi:hypothetical protein